MKKQLQSFLANQKKNLAAAAVLGAGAMSSAFAVGLDLTADITAAKTDVITNGTAILGVVVAVVTFAWIRRVLR